LFVAGALALLPIAGSQPSEARDPHPYCFQGGRGTTGGMPYCIYDTMEQCLASVAGGEGICSVNPELGWRARERAYEPPPRKSRPARRQ
jgi:hypothetical protein